MGTEDVFQVLEVSVEEHKRRQVSFAVACLGNALAVGLLAVASPWFPIQTHHETGRYVLLTFPSTPEPKPILKVPPLPKAVPKLVSPYRLPAPHVESPSANEPQIQAKDLLPTIIDQALPKTPVVPQARQLPPPSPAVHTGLFAQVQGNPGGEKAPLKEVHTGRFGNPQGLTDQAPGGNLGNVLKLGGFDSAVGPGGGGVSEGSQGSPLLVADAGFGGYHGKIVVVDTSDSNQRVVNAGFGSGGVDAQASRGGGGAASFGVKTGTFNSGPESTQAPPKRPGAATPEIRPVEILSKPTPQYTAEARRLGVQGEVVLSVIFQADGTLKVVGIIRSLGHGLDQMAELAASQIKFKPAEQGGKPTNFPAILHVEFRLA